MLVACLLAVSAIGAYISQTFTSAPVVETGTVFSDQVLTSSREPSSVEGDGVIVATTSSTAILKTPRHDTHIPAEASLVLGAEVTRGSLDAIEFLVDGDVVARQTEIPFLVEWSAIPPGSYDVTIRITDRDGEMAVGDPATVRVGTNVGCTGEKVGAGDDIQELLDSSGPGTTVCFASGEYRLTQPLEPRNGQRLVAVGEVVLNGSEILDDWRQEGDLWITDGHRHQSDLAEGAGCESGYPRCGFNEDVFIDDARLDHAASRDEVESGRFFLDLDADQVVIGDDPTGRTVEVSVTPAAIRSLAREVSVIGFVVEKFATPHQMGAIDGGEGWVVERNEVRLNHAVGIRTRPGSVIRGNYAHHNGQLGLAGNGTRSLVESNTLAANGDILWCCGRLGGSKWVLSDGITIRGNVASDHERNGLWTDINNVNVLYEFNVLRDNGLFGLHHEISFDAVIRFNLFERNGYNAQHLGDGNVDRLRADLGVNASRRVEVYGNLFRDSAAAVAAIQADRVGDFPSDLGIHELADVSVHHNRVYTRNGFMGTVVRGTHRLSPRAFLTENRIEFSANAYFLTDLSAPLFRWGNDTLDFHRWQDEGNDGDGSIRQWVSPDASETSADRIVFALPR